MTTVIRSIDTHLVENQRNLIRNPRGGVLASPGFGLQPQWFGAGGVGNTTKVAGTGLPAGVSSFMRKTWTTAPSSWSAIGYQFVVGVRRPVVAGELISISYWWRPSAALTLSQNHLLLEVYDAASGGVKVGDARSANLPSPAAGSWQLMQATLTVPATGHAMIAHLVSASAGAANGMTIDGTAAMLPTGASYFDGSSAPNGDKSYTWVGLADASESIEWLRVPVVDVRPMLLDGYETKREPGTLVHPILGRPDPDVTMRPAGLRAGVLRLVMPDAESAHAAVDALLQPHVFELVPATVTQMGMRFVVAGDEATTELDKTTRVRWIVQVPYREVHA